MKDLFHVVVALLRRSKDGDSDDTKIYCKLIEIWWPLPAASDCDFSVHIIFCNILYIIISINYNDFKQIKDFFL